MTLVFKMLLGRHYFKVLAKTTDYVATICIYFKARNTHISFRSPESNYCCFSFKHSLDSFFQEHILSIFLSSAIFILFPIRTSTKIILIQDQVLFHFSFSSSSITHFMHQNTGEVMRLISPIGSRNFS